MLKGLNMNETHCRNQRRKDIQWLGAQSFGIQSSGVVPFGAPRSASRRSAVRVQPFGVQPLAFQSLDFRQLGVWFLAVLRSAVVRSSATDDHLFGVQLSTFSRSEFSCRHLVVQCSSGRTRLTLYTRQNIWESF
jgi:hypothetical protein